MKRLSDITPAEFEAMQLEAKNVFCRRCGLVDDIAVPMEHFGIAVIEMLTEDENPWHIYRCTVCGHTAGSQSYPDEALAETGGN